MRRICHPLQLDIDDIRGANGHEQGWHDLAVFGDRRWSFGTEIARTFSGAFDVDHQ
jgi:hypothetical protein